MGVCFQLQLDPLLPASLLFSSFGVCSSYLLALHLLDFKQILTAEYLSIFQSLASLEPQKTTVKRIAQQQRLKISSDLPFRSNKKIFDSQMAAISQEKSSPTSSIVESYVSRLHSPSEGKILHLKFHIGFSTIR